MGSLAKAPPTDFKRWGIIKVRYESKNFTKQLWDGLLVAVALVLLFQKFD